MRFGAKSQAYASFPLPLLLARLVSPILLCSSVSPAPHRIVHFRPRRRGEEIVRVVLRRRRKKVCGDLVFVHGRLSALCIGWWSE